MTLQAEIGDRLAQVRGRLAEAARLARRDPADVRLVAVSKTFSLEHIQAAAQCGQQDFGENRVQEALQKMAASSDSQIRWHLIGPVQSNKTKKAAGRFLWIHSIDSRAQLERIDAAAAEAGTNPILLVQVDLAGELTKHGATPESLREIFAAGARCRAARLAGLMLLPPYFEDPERARPYFRRLRQTREALRADGIDPQILTELSMGMSHDFEVAVQEGATLVRLGTAIFGERHV